MSNRVYPDLPGLTWPIGREPVWKTTIKATASGREFRSTSQTYPRHRRSLKYEFLRSRSAYAEFQQLFDFFNARNGQYDSFLLVDRDDCSVTLQPLAVGTGSVAQYQLGRSMSDTPRNLLVSSQDFSQAGTWAINGPPYSAPVTPDAVVAPDGTMTGDLLAFEYYQNKFQHVLGLIPGQTYTFSVWLWTDTGTKSMPLWMTNTVTWVGAAKTLVTLTTTPQRFVITRTADALGRLDVGFGQTDTDQAPVGLVYAWGAQLQPGSSATSYLPNLGSSAAVPALEPVFDLAGAPRIYLYDWQGLTRAYPATRTNYQTYSEQLQQSGSWAIQSAAVSANALDAPNGAVGAADKLTETATTNSHGISGLAYGNAVAGEQWTVSAFVKGAERNMVYVWLDRGDGNGATYEFNLVSGTYALKRTNPTVWKAPSATFVSLPNGWFRVAVTCTAAMDSYCQMRLYMGDGVAVATDGYGDPSYLGVVGSGVYVWGCQVEKASSPTRYISTTTAVATVTDYAINGTGLLTFPQNIPSGTALLWSGSYYWRYRFEQDSLSLQEFMRYFWQTGEVRLLSVKP